MKREWTPEELIDCWTLGEADWRLVANKTGATRLGFAVLLKFFELEARFPRHAGEVPRAAVDYVAGQVTIHPDHHASAKVANRAGLQPTGHFRDHKGLREQLWRRRIQRPPP
jgi:Domain of unknown function (DUF4158)